MPIAVLGANGVVGRTLIPKLTARGHAVRPVVRNVEKATGPTFSGSDVREAELFDASSLEAAIAGCRIVVNVATAVPRPGSGGSWSTNTRLRTEGTRNVIAAARKTGVARVVHQSVAMVHQSADGAWVDEDSPLISHPQTQSAIDLERIVGESDLDWQIVRAGLFYGPSTGREDHYRAAARDGTLSCPGGGDDFISLIHIADMAAAVVAIVECGDSRRAWLAVDDHPVTWRTFLGHLCDLETRPAPTESEPNFLPSFRCRNRRLRAIGWSPRYADFRAGTG